MRFKETIDQDGYLYTVPCECDEGRECFYHFSRRTDDDAADLTDAIEAHPASYNTAEPGPRDLTFQLQDGREVMVTLLAKGQVTVAERSTPDHSVSWGPSVFPSSDSGVRLR
jgi:hypothetical protein